MMALLMGVKRISCDELHRLLSGNCVEVIDVNEPARWASAHVPGARCLDPSAFTGNQLPPDKGRLLVFYCSNPMCRKAPLAARRASAMGHSDVRVMSAGMQGWLRSGFAVVSG
jgi:rhodanese-related sulfurtransferase